MAKSMEATRLLQELGAEVTAHAAHDLAAGRSSAERYVNNRFEL